MTDPGDFHSNHYLRLNQRRLEHLASLGLDFRGASVLELGAGIGDLSPFFLDRDCEVTSVDARPENLERMAANIAAYYAFYRSSKPARHHPARLDLEREDGTGLGQFDVVHCYGLLYHLRDPDHLVRLMGTVCRRLCLVETCVSYGTEAAIRLTPEDAAALSQAFGGLGCRPTRVWVLEALKKVFPHVYVPATQPDHEEFPLDWTEDVSEGVLTRAVFVASRVRLDNPRLMDGLPNYQTRC